MSIGFSNKIILITEKPRILSSIKVSLSKFSLEIETSYPALSSIPIMRKGVLHSGKTAFIRTELLRFIKEKGFPRAIFIDSQIDLGIEPAHDPGMLKIFKTLLIAYIILSKGTDLRSLKGNFIILTKGNAFEKEYKFQENPYGIMNILTSQNPEINFFIDELKENKNNFDALFSFMLLDTQLPSDLIVNNIAEFLKKTGQNEPAEKQTTEEKPAAETKLDDETPARIVYRIDNISVYDDGNIITELSDEYTQLREKEFYMIGSWSSNTELKVSKKIASVLQKGISEKARFGFGNAVIFNLDDRCIIDKNTTLSIAQLFKKNLALFKNIKITVSAKNGILIQKSRGYHMIKDILTISPETEKTED